MRFQQLCFLACLSVLAGCGGGGSDASSAGPVDLRFTATPSATIVQHGTTTATVTVRDGAGVLYPNVAVQFGPAAASDSMTSTTVLTDSQGQATWSGYVHGSGSQQLLATAQGTNLQATQTLTVVASPFRFDGVYDCDAPASMTSLAISIVANIPTAKAATDPAPVCTGQDFAASFDPATAALIANRSCVFRDPLWQRYEGTISIDPRQFASVKGTAYRHQPGSFYPVGDWNCKRR